MPATLTALFAVAIHGARRSEADPSELLRAATMLVTATGSRKVTWSIADGMLLVNGIPLQDDSPGVDQVYEAMSRHAAQSVILPIGMTTDQWSDLARIFAAAPGLYPTPEHVRAAVQGVVSGVEFVATVEGVINDQAAVVESLRDAPEKSEAINDIHQTDPSLVSADADRANLSDLLDPVLDAGRDAVDRRDWPALASALLGMGSLAARGDEATKAIIVRERNRVVPSGAIEMLARLLPRAGRNSAIAQALKQLGGEAAEVILDILSEGPARADRRTYLGLLMETPDIEPSLMRALNSVNPNLVVDAAEVLGRIRSERAVPELGILLGHANTNVSTAAWHALESIGTAEAVKKLNS